jgi:alpha-beta hydrolase superfamily lysophospholipase
MPAPSTHLFVLIHGLGGSRQSWLEDEAYTHGARLTRELTRRGIAWIAADLYGHGDWHADEADFDTSHIPDACWPSFVARSVNRLCELTRQAVAQGAYTQLTLLSYSAGSTILAKLAQEALGCPVKTLVLASPIPDRDMDDTYSLHNNPAAFAGRRCLVYGGEADEDVPLAELRDWFEGLDAGQKCLRLYAAGHALPAAWVDDLISNLGLRPTP